MELKISIIYSGHIISGLSPFQEQYASENGFISQYRMHFLGDRIRLLW